MVVVEVVQVLGLILTKTPETLVDLAVVEEEELASLQVMEVHKILVVTELLEVILHLLRKDKLVVTHHLTLVVMVVTVVIMEKVEVKLEMVETEETKLTLHKVVTLEILIEVQEVHQVAMDTV